MKYNTTLDHFFSDDDFGKYFSDRIHSLTTTIFKTQIKGNSAFFTYDSELITKIITLNEKNFEFNLLFNTLPIEAQDRLLRSLKADEIRYSIDLEGKQYLKKDAFRDIYDLVGNKKNKIKKISSSYDEIIKKRFNHAYLDPKEIRSKFDFMFLSSDSSFVNTQHGIDGRIFRKKLDWVCDVEDSEFIHRGLETEKEIITCIDEAISMYKKNKIDSFTKIILYYYFFLYAHPFYDGNGLIARYFMSSQIAEEFSVPFSLCLSKTLFSFRSRYSDSFTDTYDSRNCGDLTTFVFYFADMLIKGYESSIRYIQDKSKLYINSTLRLKDEYEGKSSKTDFEIMSLLLEVAAFDDFGADVEEITGRLDCSTKTVYRCFDELKKNGLLKYNVSNKHKYYFLNLENLNKNSK